MFWSRWFGLTDLEQMELVILKAVKDYGKLSYTALRFLDSPAAQRIINRYPDVSPVTSHSTAIALCRWLVRQERLLRSGDTEGMNIYGTEGLTPIGERRLFELEHPFRAWVKANAFAVAVAVMTIIVGGAGAAGAVYSAFFGKSP